MTKQLSEIGVTKGVTFGTELLPKVFDLNVFDWSIEDQDCVIDYLIILSHWDQNFHVCFFILGVAYY